MTVFVAVYSYKYDEAVRVFATHDAALAWRDQIAEAYFENQFPHDPKPTSNIGEAYFILQAESGDEYFSVIETEIEKAA